MRALVFDLVSLEHKAPPALPCGVVRKNLGVFLDENAEYLSGKRLVLTLSRLVRPALPLSDALRVPSPFLDERGSFVFLGLGRRRGGGDLPPSH